MTGYKKTFKLPFKYDIPNFLEIFIQQSSFFGRLSKYLKRYIYIYIKKQAKLEVHQIIPEHKSILWINLSAPSIGDSLMDLSSRVLLHNKKIDLFTDKKNSNLYENDLIFNNVYTQIKELKTIQYDLVILDSYSTRTIRVKSAIEPLTPYVGMFGYYNGPEVNRVLFSYHQMNRLLGYKKSEEEINMSCKASVNISKDDKYLIRSLNLPSECISIVIGGEWGYRTFQKWGEVIRHIFDMNQSTYIVLIGSSNGSEDARKLEKAIDLNRLFNCVNQYSYLQTVEIIRNSKLLLCCDGGLMHGANAVETPIISLFARLTPKMQLTDRNHSFSLYDKDDVNNIQVGEIMEQYAKFMSYDGSHPRVL